MPINHIIFIPHKLFVWNSEAAVPLWWTCCLHSAHIFPLCFFPLSWQVPVLMPMDLMVEASPRRIFANAHTYHINSISVNSDHETYLSADDLRINLWHLEITDRSFSILLSLLSLILECEKLELCLSQFRRVLRRRPCRQEATVKHNTV